VSNVQALFSDWEFVGSTLGKIPGENTAFHTNLKGLIRARYKDSGTSGDFPATTTAHVHGSLPYDPRVGHYCLATDEIPSTISYISPSLEDFINSIALYNWDITIMAVDAQYDFYLKDFNYLITDSHVELITSYWSHRGNPISVPNASFMRVYRQVIRAESTPVDAMTLPLSDCVSLTYRLDVHSIGWDRVSDGKYKLYEQYKPLIAAHQVCSGELEPSVVFSNGYKDTALVPLVRKMHPGIGEMIGRPPYPKTLVGGEDYSLHHFREVCFSLSSDLLPLIGLAAQSTLADSIASFDINNYENWEGLRTLFGLVDVLKLLKEARRLEVKGTTIKAALDLLADARLTYSYSLSPTKNDIKTIRGGAKEFRNRWFGEGGYFGAKAIRNTEPIAVDIPTSLTGPFTLRASARCMLKGSFNPDAILIKLLPLDAVGALPRLSYLWATLPFSFVFDNLINISSALDVLDNFVINNAVWHTDSAVGSYTVSWEFSEENNPLDYQWEVFQESYLKYVDYTRVTFVKVPIVGPSRVLGEYYGSSMPSDLATYGALAWRLFT
jgi:hypothetical protein